MLNINMTAEDKTTLAVFINNAAAYFGNGFLKGNENYNFSDDKPIPEESAVTEETVITDSLEKIASEIQLCKACCLCEKRKNTVPGEGVKNPLVMVIGEAPGADEDASGRPFVGRAGRKLDEMLAAIDLSREKNCFIANTIKCRPPGNRDPLPEETSACNAFLERQVKLLDPAFILCAGGTSAKTILGVSDSLKKLRGNVHEYKSIPVFVTYHPSAILQYDEYRRPAWEDLKMLRSALKDYFSEYETK